MARNDDTSTGVSCPTCDRECSTERGMRSHHTQVHGDPLPNRTCADCGRAFHDEHNDRTYCEDCYAPVGAANPAADSATRTTRCAVCDAQFEYYPSDKAGRYCAACVADDSVTCTPRRPDPAARVTVDCHHCDAAITVYRHVAAQQSAHFCDRACYAAWLSATQRAAGKWRGADNPNWRDGVDTSAQYGPGWAAARQAALDRDDHTCQRCGATRADLGSNPDVHHIVPVRTFDEPTDAHTLDNLVCLCRRCHVAVERGDATVAQPASEPAP